MVKRQSFVRIVLAVVMVLIASMAWAVGTGGKLAPVNPEFINYQRFEKTGVSSSQSSHPLGYSPSPVDLSHINNVRLRASVPDSKGFYSKSSTPFPSSYDLRDYGYVTSVKQQGWYGTCWAFASLASLESTFKRNSGEDDDFSEWHLSYFAYVSYGDSMPVFTSHSVPTGYDVIFDQGGSPWKATALLSRWVGVVDEADRPYQDVNPWPESSRPLASDPISKHLDNVYYLGSDADPEIMKYTLMNYGAMTLGVVWNWSSINELTNAYYNNSEDKDGSHLVTLVGWDDSYPAANFNDDPGSDGAWLLKNSWGEEWGGDGYFWVSYADEGLADCMVFAGTSSSNFQNVYQYDPLGLVNNYGYGKEEVTFANVFTSKGIDGGDEILEAVSFYSLAADVSFDLEVWIDGVVRNPRSGTKVSGPENGVLAVPGYRTVYLDSPVTLAPGTRFALVMRLETPGYYYPVPVECPYPSYSEEATAEPDQSYVSSDDVTWCDLTSDVENTNICLKAFTGAPALRSGVDFTSYFIPGQISSDVDCHNHRIDVLMPYDSDLSDMVAAFGLSPEAAASIGDVSQAGGTTHNDFTGSLTYEVTAEDGETLDWVVSVETIMSPLMGKDILSYSLPYQTDSLVDSDSHTVEVVLPYHMDLDDDFAANFKFSEGASVSIGKTAQRSGTTVNNFNTFLIYTITAQDGSSQDWKISVTVADPLTGHSILCYSFDHQISSVVYDESHSVEVIMPYDSDVTDLTAAFTLSKGAFSLVDDYKQRSGVSAHDFSSPVTYSVTAQDKTVQDWVVSVSKSEAVNSGASGCSLGFTPGLLLLGLPLLLFISRK